MWRSIKGCVPVQAEVTIQGPGGKEVTKPMLDEQALCFDQGDRHCKQSFMR